MHTCGRGATPETPEERRNRILRVRCGEVSATGKPKEERKSPFRFGSDIGNNFVIVGQTMNTFMRLPQISRDVTTHKRQLTNGKKERISFMAFNSLARSVDDLHISTNIPACTAGRDMDDVITEISFQKGEFENRRNSCGIEGTSLRTAPSGVGRRRWSDSAAGQLAGVEGGVLQSGQVRTNQERGRTLGLQQRPMNLVKSDTACITQNADELLQEYKEFAKRKDGIPELHETEKAGITNNGEGRFIASINSQRGAEYFHSNQVARNNGIGELSRSRSNGLPNASITGKPKPNRRQTTNMNLFRNKRGVLIPSGDSSGGRRLSVEATTSKTGSATRMLQKRSSRMLGGKRSSTLRKSDMNMKPKKVPPRPESPPVPTEEDMQELQDLPVIRKFLKMPPSRPKVVCFDYPGVDLTHVDVKRAIEKAIPGAFESGKVVSVQFENVNVKLATGGLDNRWLIELRDFATRNLLIKNGLAIDCPEKHSLVDLKILAPPKSDESTTTSGDEEEFITFPPIKYPKKVEVKLNDSVSMEEYKLYLRRTAAEEKLQNVILLCAGRGDKLLTTML
uniref:uncharacterized protein LOC120336594 isoform X1 n=1 Tax=Styela clava TaxID=7725 RepID=UPI001939DA5D|nr:uncharacterized protein LOC120336594 isoform X1 [Styela clava]